MTDSTSTTTTTTTLAAPKKLQPPSLDYTTFRDILLLGEANFSFTRAMIRHLKKQHRQQQQPLEEEQDEEQEQRRHHHRRRPLPRITATEYGSSVNIANRYFNGELRQLSASLNQLQQLLVQEETEEEDEDDDETDNDNDNKDNDKTGVTNTTTRTTKKKISKPIPVVVVVEFYASLDATNLAKRGKRCGNEWECCDDDDGGGGGGGGGGSDTTCNPERTNHERNHENDSGSGGAASHHGTATTTTVAAGTATAHATATTTTTAPIERWNPMTQTWDHVTCFWDASSVHHSYSQDDNDDDDVDDVSEDGFDLIIFNFPHTTKHGKASRLLKLFFQQVQQCLIEDANAAADDADDDDDDYDNGTDNTSGHLHKNHHHHHHRHRRRLAPHVVIELRLRDDESPHSPIHASNKIRAGYNHLSAAHAAQFDEWKMVACDSDTTNTTLSDDNTTFSNNDDGNNTTNNNENENDLPYWESLGYQHCMTQRNATCRGLPCKVWRFLSTTYNQHKNNNDTNSDTNINKLNSSRGRWGRKVDP
jgi:hypothetical protein